MRRSLDIYDMYSTLMSRLRLEVVEAKSRCLCFSNLRREVAQAESRCSCLCISRSWLVRSSLGRVQISMSTSTMAEVS